MIQKNISLLKYNTFGIDAISARFFEYKSEKELQDALKAGEITKPFLQIGGGSNLLFTRDYPGLILHSQIDGVEVIDENAESVWLRVGAGVVWDRFVAYCVDHEWYGAENLSYIPGEVGASAVQNIGAYGVEAKDLITKVETINLSGDKTIYDVKECHYGYRDSIFKHAPHCEEFVTYVTFTLSKIQKFNLNYGSVQEETDKYPELNLKNVRQAIINIRQTKLPEPEILGNAGSFYKNPVISGKMFGALQAEYPAIPFYQLPDDKVKIPAAWLIEQCGLKGFSDGDAGVHDKQPLVLINKGKAKGCEILALSDKIRKAVKDKFGIDLMPEVTII